MTIQRILEAEIQRLVTQFLDMPYRFFTEADAVARFHQMLERNPELNQRRQTLDGQTVSLVHREYPTFFRFDDKNPVAKLESRARRGHYDTVILNPAFIEAHNAETVVNRSINHTRDKGVRPFQAVVEFKLDNQGWSRGQAKGAVAEMGKLRLSADEAPLRYLVVLMRYTAPNLNRWEKYWPQVSQATSQYTEIGVFSRFVGSQSSESPRSTFPAGG